MSVLALDISGVPRQWISNDDAITYHAKDAVAWALGDVVAKYRGGLQKDGEMSYLETSSIIAIKGHGFNPYKHATVALSNRTLFGRDRYVCAYCGGHLKESRMELLYTPYAPSHYENMILQNRTIRADQMEYLLAGVPKHSRIWLS